MYGWDSSDGGDLASYAFATMAAPLNRRHVDSDVAALAASSAAKRTRAPKFSKPKEEGWILVLGTADNRELLALKRVGAVTRTSKQTLLITPVKPGRMIYTLYVMR